MQQHWPQVRAWFDRLIDLDAAAREQALAQIEDVSLRADVAKLLQADANTHRNAAQALNQVLPQVLAQVQQSDDPPGTMVGPWRIVGALGEGGMGTVYLAERDMPGFVQRAALKRLHAVSRQNAAAEERFGAEQRVLAALTSLCAEVNNRFNRDRWRARCVTRPWR